jgi:hypothetical protein
MDYFRRFTFLFATPNFDAEDLEGIRFNQIVDEIERSGFEVVKARKLEDAEIAVQTDAAISAGGARQGSRRMARRSPTICATGART